MAKIKGGAVKSMAGLKASLKKGGGSQYLTRVPSEESVTVRFLTEPEEWYGYYEHYDAIRKFYPCSDDCPGCTEGDRPSGRYLANALDVSENRVVPLVLPKSAVSSLVKKHEKYGTMLDRDYEISRSGQGFDTEYDVTPEAPTRINLSRYDLLDLEELLESQLNMAEASEASDDDSDDDDDMPIKPYRNSKKTPAPVVDDSDDDDDDDVDDDDTDVSDDSDDVADADDSDDAVDDADEGFSRDELLAMSLAEVKALAKEVGFAAPDLRGKDKDSLAELILTIYDTDDSDDDSDDDEITEEQLREMPLAEVKAIAKDMGIRMKAGIAKDDIIELILDAAGEDDDDDDDEEDAPF